MGCGRHDAWADPRARIERKIERLRDKLERWSEGGGRDRRWSGPGRGFAASGNRAFDEYRAETLKRLEEEASEFKAFLERLRHAKDKAEFDQFMADRRSRPGEPPASPTEAPRA